ncbi:PAS domain-containing protein [Kordiimonas lipolytica]|uniref:PAS domain-containing protein n=1 Tax=Kordiimonas lipolytica TaxID=1662421 RepID=A0ABV8U8K6_9PROT|nr:PAS domain-containing protein [Kordiimonas lipolytica]
MAGISILRDLVSGGSAGAPSAGVLYEDNAEAIIRQSELAALYQFWIDKKSSLGKLPCRGDFSPLELTRLLPHIALVDVDTKGHSPEFTFRLCGTQIAEDSGVDLTGKTWSQFPNSDDVIKRAVTLTHNLQPYYATNIQAKWAPKNFHHYSVLALPLSKDGDTVDMILYGIMFHPFSS